MLHYIEVKRNNNKKENHEILDSTPFCFVDEQITINQT